MDPSKYSGAIPSQTYANRLMLFVIFKFLASGDEHGEEL